MATIYSQLFIKQPDTLNLKLITFSCADRDLLPSKAESAPLGSVHRNLETGSGSPTKAGKNGHWEKNVPSACSSPTVHQGLAPPEYKPG